MPLISPPKMKKQDRLEHLSFKKVAICALSHSEVIVRRLLPHGEQKGMEWVATNPKRSDRSPGSFCVNLKSGLWSDFATDDKGGDLISLVAYLKELNQLAAAQWLAAEIGMEV